MAYKIISLPDSEYAPSPIPSASKQESSLLNETLGALKRAPVRALESGLGLAGDILQGVGNIAVGAGRKLGLDMTPDFYSPLPTSSQLKKGTEYLTGETFKPTTEVGKNIDEFVGDITSLVLPDVFGKGKLASKAIKGIKKALPVAAAGNLASFLTKQVGGDESTAQIAKVGTMLLSSVGLSGGIDKAKADAYAKADLVPEGLKIPSKDAYKKLLKVEDSLARRSFPGKDDVEKVLQSALYNFEGNSIEYSKAWQAAKDSNAWYKELGKKPVARQELNKITRILKDDVLFDAQNLVADSKLKPLLKEASEGIKLGDTLFRDSLNISDTTKWLNDNITLSRYGAGGIIGHLLGIPSGTLAATGGITETLKQGVNFLDPFLRSKTLQKTYSNIVKNALKEDLPAVLKSINKMDSELIKLYPELQEEQASENGKFKIISLG